MRQMPPRETRAAAHAPAGRAAGVLRPRRAAASSSPARGDAAAWKAELLAAAGAHVEVFAPDPCAELDALVASAAGRQHRRCRAGEWRGDDLRGRGAGDRRVGRRGRGRVRRGRARSTACPSTSSTRPRSRTFSFGSIVNRSPVVIGISTGGARAGAGAGDPRARSRRCCIRRSAPGRRRRSGCARRSRRACRWGRRAATCGGGLQIARSRHAPRRAEQRLARSRVGRVARKAARVALVGAGPGDPELLTLKALRALQSADVILYDRLVSPEILELARREAKRMLVGKAGGGASCRQDDINALMVRLARDGKRVVRLKGGDPMMFGRAAEEIARLPRRRHSRRGRARHHGGAGRRRRAAGAADRPTPRPPRAIRHRARARRAVLRTHDWPSLADPWTTTAFYMSARTFADMLPKLIAAGLDPATPALAISAATTPRSRHVACAVADLPMALANSALPQPCLILVGNGVGRSLRRCDGQPHSALAGALA